MKYLVITLRPDFDPQVIPAYYAFLEKLRSKAQLEEAGPFTDQSGGAYVLSASGLDESRHLAEQDPLNLQRCSTIAVYGWDAS
jgi:uncharacterized protein YciI